MTGMNSLDIVEIAMDLEEARINVTPIGFISEAVDGFSWVDARSIARASDQLRQDAGEMQIGWKLGWTSEAMRTALGIDRPNWGTLWDTQVTNTQLPINTLIHPKIEPELVWRCPIDVNTSLTTDELSEVGGEWALGIEVVDPRFPSFNFDALDNTADNSSSAAIRLGDFASIADDPAKLEVVFSNGEDVRVGPGSQAMGSPLEAVCWLSRSLAEEDLSISAGDIVFTGGLTAPYDAVPGTTYSLSCGPLAATSLSFY